MDTLQTQLQSVVYASGNPWVFSYTIQNLGNGVPPESPWWPRLQETRQHLLIDLVRMSRGLPPLHAPRQRPGQAIPWQFLLQRKQFLRRKELQVGELLRPLSDSKKFLEGLFQEMVRQDAE